MKKSRAKKPTTYQMSGNEWRSLTLFEGWINRYSEGDIIEVFYNNGRVFRFRVVTQKIAEVIE